MSYDGLTFEVTDAPPTRHGSGRARTNPFRGPLEESYKNDFAGTNEWYQCTVDTDAVERAVNAIRSAGQMVPKIGTEVRADRETGVIAFRGVQWEPRAASAENGDGDESGRHSLNEDPEIADY